MIFMVQRIFILLIFLSVVPSVRGFVPRSVVFPDITEGMLSSPRQDRHFNVQVAFDTADGAYEDAVGVLGVYQRFNLRDIAKSADLCSREQGLGAYIPPTLQTVPQWQGKNIVYNTQSSIRAQRLLLAYSDFISLSNYADYISKDHVIKHRLMKGGSFCFGISLPLISVQSSNLYQLERYSSVADIQRSLPEIDEKAERLRAELFKKIGLSSNVWDHAGLGDLEVYAGLESHTEYFLRLRTFDLGVLFGCLFPTGMQRDQNYPSSLPLGLSSASMTLQTFCNLGLKDYLNVGLTTGLVITRPKKHEMRIPVYQEPAAYSPLVTEILVSPGLTTWLNPYLQIKNIANNLHVAMNYAWVWHGLDSFKNEQISSLVKSVDIRAVSDELGVTFADQSRALARLNESSAWRTRHLGLTLTYEPWQADKDSKLNPLLSLGCQFSYRGKNAPKMYHIYGNLTFQF